MKRTFIGLKIEPNQVLLHIISDLKKRLDGEYLRWVDPQNMHLTLRFLGNTEDSQLEDITKALAVLIPQYSQFSLDIVGLGIFGKRSLPKILWAGVKMPQNIYNLAANIEDVVCKAGFEQETKQYSPHLTMCRIKALKESAHLLELVDQYEQTHFLTQNVNEIILYESVLRSFGAVYVPIRKFDLSNPL